MKLPARDYGYLLPFGIVGGIFAIVTATQSFQGLGLFVTFVGLPLADRLIGLSRENPTPAQERELGPHPWYRGLLFAWAAVQLSLIGLGLWRIHLLVDPPLWKVALLAIPLGLTNGGIGITVAHELGHRSERFDRWVARVLLLSVSYGHFTIEHNQGHHVRVATPDDPATARLGEGFWRFLVRTVPTQYLHAWELENARCRRNAGRALVVGNAMLWLTLVPLVLVGGLFAVGGAKLAVYFAAQSAFSILLLEAVNYVEHYGLRRRELSTGRYEPVAPHHSWNASFAITNWTLFALQRHSDHHASPGRPYQLLRHVDGAPQLPAGYPVMIMLALVPPLWHRVMAPRAQEAARLGAPAEQPGPALEA